MIHMSFGEDTVTLGCDWRGCYNTIEHIPFKDGDDITKVIDGLDLGWWWMDKKPGGGEDEDIRVICSAHGRYHRAPDHYCAEDRCSGYWENIALYDKAKANTA